MKSLADVCKSEFSAVVRCGAGGRDHLPCCARRGVPAACQPLCQAVHQQSTGADFLQCLPNIGEVSCKSLFSYSHCAELQVVTCWEEGSLALPAPVSRLRAVSVQDTAVVLDWQPGHDPSNQTIVTQFEVYYKLVGDNSSSAGVFEADKVNCTTDCYLQFNGQLLE